MTIVLIWRFINKIDLNQYGQKFLKADAHGLMFYLD